MSKKTIEEFFKEEKKLKKKVDKLNEEFSHIHLRFVVYSAIRRTD